MRRQLRTESLLLVSSNGRIVLEVDGKTRYALTAERARQGDCVVGSNGFGLVVCGLTGLCGGDDSGG